MLKVVSIRHSERMRAYALARQVPYSVCVCRRYETVDAFPILSFREMSQKVCRNFPLEINTYRDKVVLLISDHN